MAEIKKSFVLYSDLISIVKKLVLKDRDNKTNHAGELFLHILEYVNGNEPVPIDFIVEMAFEPVKLQLKRDLEKYEVVKEKRSQAGKKSAEVKKQTATLSTNSTHVESVEQTSTNSTVNDNDTVTDNDNDTVTDNDILLKKETKNKNFDFRKNLIDFGFKEKLIDDWLKVRKTKKATNTETAFKKFILEVQKSERDFNEILELCISKDWKGFQAEWLKNLQNLNNGKQFSNTGGTNTNQGYKPASVNTEKLVRELTNDFEVGNVPGQY